MKNLKTSAILFVALVSAGVFFPGLMNTAQAAARPSYGSGGKVGTFSGESITVNSVNRAYHLSVPNNLPSAAAVPLLFAYHGCCGDNAEAMSGYTRFDKIAAEKGFIVIYPQSASFSWPTYYNANAEEVVLFDALYNLATTKYNIDLNRVYVVAMSQGALFANSLVAQRSDKIAAFGSHSSGLGDTQLMVNKGTIVIKYKYPVMAVHGADDSLVSPQQSKDMVSVFQGWGHEAKYVEIPGLGHSWAITQDISHQFWDFFAARPMNASSSGTQKPTGFLDGIRTDGAVFGWASDSDNLSAALKVHLYFDKNAGTSGATPFEVTASEFRSDVGNHAFSFPVPSQYRNGQPHQVWAWALDLTDTSGASNVMLLGSPKSFTLSSLPISPPVINSFTAYPNPVTLGQSTTLSWNVSNAGSISMDQGIGNVTGLSSVLALPTASSTVYTLTATNASGSATAKVTVTATSIILPPPAPGPVPTPTPTPTPTPPPSPLPQGPWNAQYYKSSKLIKFLTPALSRTDNSINFDWGAGSPGSAVPSDLFAARWTANINFPAAGTYTFTANTDDGMRIWIDNKSVLDKWTNQSSTYTFSQSLSAGNHSLKVEYYENTGGAKASLSWVQSAVAGAMTLPQITQTLSYGALTGSPEVFALQEYLYTKGYLAVAPTGYFGSMTEAAVMELQSAYGILPTGIVGPLTRDLINRTW